MTILHQKEMPLKAYSIHELALIYEVDSRTFKKWLKPLQSIIGEKQGRYYKIPQVRIIFENLGLPSSIVSD